MLACEHSGDTRDGYDSKERNEAFADREHGCSTKYLERLAALAKSTWDCFRWASAVVLKIVS